VGKGKKIVVLITKGDELLAFKGGGTFVPIPSKAKEGKEICPARSEPRRKRGQELLVTAKEKTLHPRRKMTGII